MRVECLVRSELTVPGWTEFTVTSVPATTEQRCHRQVVQLLWSSALAQTLGLSSRICNNVAYEKQIPPLLLNSLRKGVLLSASNGSMTGVPERFLALAFI